MIHDPPTAASTRALSASDLRQHAIARGAAGFSARPVAQSLSGGVFMAGSLVVPSRIAPPPPPVTPAAPAAPRIAAPDPAAEMARQLEETRAAGHAEGHAAGLAAGREAGHAAGLDEGRSLGHAEGIAEGQARAEADLAAARDAFAALIGGLGHGLGAETERLGAALTEVVLSLASARAGEAIDARPGPFVTRIEALAERLSQGLREVTIRLNPADHAAIRPHLAQSEILSNARIEDAARLIRGDVEVRADGVSLTDILLDAIRDVPL